MNPIPPYHETYMYGAIEDYLFEHDYLSVDKVKEVCDYLDPVIEKYLEKYPQYVTNIIADVVTACPDYLISEMFMDTLYKTGWYPNQKLPLSHDIVLEGCCCDHIPMLQWACELRLEKPVIEQLVRHGAYIHTATLAALLFGHDPSFDNSRPYIKQLETLYKYLCSVPDKPVYTDIKTRSNVWDEAQRIFDIYIKTDEGLGLSDQQKKDIQSILDKTECEKCCS